MTVRVKDCDSCGIDCESDYFCAKCKPQSLCYLVCDVCGEIFGETIPPDIYDVDGEELCEECLKEKFKR